jgi:hypothetical protein
MRHNTRLSPYPGIGYRLAIRIAPRGRGGQRLLLLSYKNPRIRYK